MKKDHNVRKNGLAWWYVSVSVLVIAVGSSIIAFGVYCLLVFLNVLKPENISTVGIVISIVAACAIVGAFVAGIISRTFTKPVEECIGVIEGFARGEYSSRLDTSRGRDQIKSLKVAINKTADELEKTEAMRTDFINDVSHEYKTPVASILGYAGLLKSGCLDETQKKYVDIIIEESHRLGTMTTNVLLLNRFENTEIVTDKKLFSLDEELRRCFQYFQNEWLGKDITISGEFNSVMYYGNPDILQHIWGNIVGNAIKFTDKGGEITCFVGQEGKNAIVKIGDNGCGIDEETQKHIFDKFYQKEGSGKTEGNGLGLALAKRAAELCGGVIEVRSEPDIGTEFKVTLPNESPDQDL